MKKVLSLVIITLLLSCKNEKAEKKEGLFPDERISAEQVQINLGEEIFSGKGNCYACHKADQKIIGPSLQEMVEIYEAKNGNMYNFLKNDAAPIVEPSQYEVMKTNFSITKAMSDEELNALIAYVYTFKK